MLRLPRNIRTRIAPTPSGYLHLGNGLAFMLTWLIARKTQGHLSLRIDDIDKARYRKEYVTDILENLDWLGLEYDEGAKSIVEFETKFSQHLRLRYYENVLVNLQNKGELFACTCSRKQINRLSSNGIYPGTCRDKLLSFKQVNIAWRIKLHENATVNINDIFRSYQNTNLSQLTGDFVLKTKQDLPAYQLVSVLEDERTKQNLIIRGDDLLYSSLMQSYLANSLGLEHFPKVLFLHHTLLLENGQKLSKTKGSLALYQLRKRWQSPVKFYRLIAKILNYPDWATIDRLNLLLERFDITQIPQKAINLADLDLE